MVELKIISLIYQCLIIDHWFTHLRHWFHGGHSDACASPNPIRIQTDTLRTWALDLKVDRNWRCCDLYTVFYVAYSLFCQDTVFRCWCGLRKPYRPSPGPCPSWAFACAQFYSAWSAIASCCRGWCTARNDREPDLKSNQIYAWLFSY